jgi:2-oxoglutarate ferredoxin oxidoreductase subunit beta
MAQVQAHQAKGEIATGLLYVERDARDMHAAMGTAAGPLNAMGESQLCPGAGTLAKINASLR